MNFIRRYRWVFVAIGAAAVIAAFLAFRPDKLFVDDAVDESLSEAFVTATVATTSTSTMPSTSTVGEEQPVPQETTTTSLEPTTTASTQPAQPLVVSTGDFFGINHSAEGTATVYEQDGSYVLRFEDDTNIQNGPDLYVWVLESDEYQEGTPPEYIDLGKIKGNVGGQNYELPAEYDPDVHQFVLIWCLRFASPFAAAPLA